MDRSLLQRATFVSNIQFKSTRCVHNKYCRSHSVSLYTLKKHVGRCVKQGMRVVAQKTGEETATSSTSATIQGGQKEPILVDSNILEFCTVDPNTGEKKEMTLGEKELLFMDAISSYYRGEPILSNTDFDILQEELAWQGSKMVLLNRDELRFLEAYRAYSNGNPIMSDQEFDELKAKLKKSGSSIALQKGPRCSIVTETCYCNCVPDRTRMLTLYLPAAGIAALIYATVTFEFTPLRHITPVLNLLIGTPVIAAAAKIATELFFPNPLILVGECPSCTAPVRAYFGDAFGIKGNKREAFTQCERCRANLKFSEEKSQVELVKDNKMNKVNRASERKEDVNTTEVND
ncbi:hypothetical protein GpartN1_g289.t1 [Galdieria partita]|uniref:Uncharacterized protein n=1 Tax=Galdieria partita TaxID=83374 RepID=A0A9C7UMD0_9RHOD|nr:hypothetical protein GpartN1_g289.t1 [Galdieria partita]